MIREMMKKSYEILVNHPINIKRKEMGLNPANSAWFWGAGTKPALQSFYEKTGKRGAMISAVDLLKGIAVGSSMDVILVDGANGGLHTNYTGKMEAAADALLHKGYDFVYIHVEAPDEMGHQGLVNEKIQAIEKIDEYVVRPLIEKMEASKEDYRMLVLPDHPTPICIRTHTAGPIPYVLYDSRRALGNFGGYSEKIATEGGIYREDGYQLIDVLFEN